ncbi:MAG: tryptophan 7-halogenase [Salinisphaera sp.]|nr:tryptophan 7-halogenase [Salinisphaera sp.]
MSESRTPPMRILVVGGGTAGWMAATLMAHSWRDRDIEISLIESQKIGIIGVGEASTPLIRRYFDRLGIAESEWMPRCNATYKCGIRFPNWSQRKGFETYYHPFFTHDDERFIETFFHNTQLRRKNIAVPAHPNDFFVSNLLAQRSLAPLAGPGISYVTEYAYHFDSHLVGALLAERAEALGVRHIEDVFTSVNRHENGDIASLETENHGQVEADFFIDCTGFAGHLIGRTLDVPFHSDLDVLFNDAAVVLRKPYPDGMKVLPSEVYSGALKYGWLWKIPLADAMSFGYVYGSAFVSADDAEAEVREFIGATDPAIQARHLKIRVGSRSHCWERNCLAMGLSQGFIEPLESTGLFITQETIETFIQQFQAADFTDQHRDTVNTRVNEIFAGVRDYIFMHYKVNGRSDTEYWVANRENKAGADLWASEFLSVWDKGGDILGVMDAHKDKMVYTHTSWVCLMAGMGRFPRSPKKPGPKHRHADMDAVRANCERLAGHFPDHLGVIQAMRRGGEPAHRGDERLGLDRRGPRSIQGIDPLRG